jgi:hypothetical protein
VTVRDSALADRTSSPTHGASRARACAQLPALRWATPERAAWCERWLTTSTPIRTRRSIYYGALGHLLWRYSLRRKSRMICC